MSTELLQELTEEEMDYDFSDLMPLTEEDILTAIRVCRKFNFEAAYGRNPDLCRATNTVLKRLKEFDNE